MKMKTEHIVIGVGAGLALYFGYNHMQKMQAEKQQLAIQNQKIQQLQQQAQTQQSGSASTGSKVDTVVKDAKSVLDIINPLLTNKAKQECIAQGGTWDANGLFKKGFCVPKGTATEQVATRGTEPNQRALMVEPMYVGVTGLTNSKGQLI